MKRMIKRCGKLYFLLYMLLAVTGITLSSCNNNVMVMLENTNSHFSGKVEPYNNKLKPGDEGFDENAMLMSKYYVGTRMSLALSAPEAASYYWTLFSLKKIESAIWIGADEVERTEFALPSSVDCFKKTFGFYVPEVPGLVPGTYELLLVVTDSKGMTYMDSCEIIVYDQYYIETIGEG